MGVSGFLEGCGFEPWYPISSYAGSTSSLSFSNFKHFNLLHTNSSKFKDKNDASVAISLPLISSGVDIVVSVVG